MSTKTIDGRTPKARNLRLRGASFDMDGNVTGGKDSLSGSAVAFPARARQSIYRTPIASAAATALASGKLDSREARQAQAQVDAEPRQVMRPTNAPMMGDQLGSSAAADASTARMRAAGAARDADRVRGAVAGWSAGQRQAQKAQHPLTSTGGDLLTQRKTSAGFANSTLGRYGGGMATNMRDNDDAMIALGGRTTAMRAVETLDGARAAGRSAVAEMDSTITDNPISPEGKRMNFRKLAKF